MQDMTIHQLFVQYEAAKQRGDLDAEIDVLNQLLSLTQQNERRAAEIMVLRWLGNAYQEKSQLQKAHSYRVTAAQLAEDPLSECPPKVYMHVEGDLGRSYIEADDWRNAEYYTQRALEMAKSLADEEAECIYKVNLGLIYRGTGRVRQAHQLAEEVLRVGERLHDHYILGLQHLKLAELLLEEARINESQRHARQAWAHAELSSDPRLSVEVKHVLGKSFLLARLWLGSDQYSADAQRYLRETVELAQKMGNLSLEADAEFFWAELCNNRQQAGEAMKHYQRDLELLESLRQTLGYEEFQRSFFRSFKTSYESITEFLLRHSQPDQAFLTIERLHSRLLLAHLGQGRGHIGSRPEGQQNELKEILNTYGQEVIQHLRDGVQGETREVTVGLKDLDDGEATSDTPTLREARQSFLRLYDTQRLNQASWQARQSPPAISFEAAQRLLGKDEALLAYLVTEQSVIIFVATDQERHFQHLAYPREKLVKDIEEVNAAMRDVQGLVLNPYIYGSEWLSRGPQDPWPKIIIQPMARLHKILEKLYALLIAPVLALVDKRTHWVVVPYGPLHRVPWSALRSGGHYLVEKHSVSLLPSTSIGAALREISSSKVDNVLFMADPDADDPKLWLPRSQDEVQAGYSIFRAGLPPFIGPAATKQAFLQYAPSTQVVHLSCHHFFDAQAPFLSFLKLTGNRGADYLYTFEIAELDLQAELVVLSACESASSQIDTGDEQYGMVRAFLVAGVPAVVSTLWLIEDDSATNFFRDFYKNAGKCVLGEALAVTQRNMLADRHYELPNFWAAYTLSGKWGRPLASS